MHGCLWLVHALHMYQFILYSRSNLFVGVASLYGKLKLPDGPYTTLSGLASIGQDLSNLDTLYETSWTISSEHSHLCGDSIM